MPDFEGLREPVKEILSETPDRYWLSCQIVNELKDRYPEIIEQLKYDNGAGRENSEKFSPETAVSHCLRNWNKINIQFLNGRDISIEDPVSPGSKLGIYKWME